MSIVALKLSSRINISPIDNTPLNQSAEYAIWDTAGSTAYVSSVGGIPLADDVQTYLTANATALLADAIASGQEMPTSVEGRATLLQKKAVGKVSAGCVAGTLKASTLFAGFAQGKKNAINAVLDSAATLENTFMSAPGLVL